MRSIIYMCLFLAMACSAGVIAYVENQIPLGGIAVSGWLTLAGLEYIEMRKTSE